jgi:hypothetical protein
MGLGLGANAVICRDDAACSYYSNRDQAAGPSTFSSAFDGQVPTGNWTLYVGDSAPQDLGTLVDWILVIRHLRLLTACSASPFPDVPTTSQFCMEIQWMRDEGVSTGFANGNYQPATSVTRAAMSAFMARLSDADLQDCTTPPFPDVPVTHPFCREIKWMAESGVATGFGNGTFRPAVVVTRQAMAAFMARLTGRALRPCVTAPFLDVPVSHPFCREIKWMKDKSISDGFGDGTYRPSNPVTRQAMSAFMNRVYPLLP